MRQFRAAAVVVLLVFGFSTLASATLVDFLRRVDTKAKQDINRFNSKLSVQFGVPVPRVDDIVKRVPSPADAFMVLQLGQMSNRPPEEVLRVYDRSRDKGWGEIARELGIKPGSPEFHALKNGNMRYEDEDDYRERGEEREREHGRHKHEHKKHKREKHDDDDDED